MRYMFLIYSQETPDGPSPEEGDSLRAAHWEVIQEATAKQVFCAAEPLSPTCTATTVRVKDGRTITLDGPFAETKEQLAGYYILNCRDLDDALDWAKKIPSGCKGRSGCIEIRPILPLPGH